MEELKESIFEEILKKTNVKINEDFYVSHLDIKVILDNILVESSQIINEKNLQEDFIEGLQSLLKRELTVKEIESLANSGILNECTDRMFDTESEIIQEYHEKHFENVEDE